MKHRSSTDKLKTGHHSHTSFLKGLLIALKAFEQWNEVDGIFPGIITKRGGYLEFKIKVQYPTPTGLKCLAVGPDGTQEVFVVTKHQEIVGAKIRELYPVPIPKVKPAKEDKRPEVKPPLTLCGIRAFGKCRICVLCKRCANHQPTLLRCRVCPV